jgi:uncharacterized protein YozE (UPF0346 family)
MAKNDYGRSQELLSDTSINDLLKAKRDYQESFDSLDAVNEWLNQNAKSGANLKEFDDIFGCYLIEEETRWFNLNWRIGCVMVAIQDLKVHGQE